MFCYITQFSYGSHNNINNKRGDDMQSKNRVFEVIRGGLDNADVRTDRQGSLQLTHKTSAQSYSSNDRSIPKTRPSILHKLFN